MPPILMLPIIAATSFFEIPHNLIRAPLVAKLEKEAMATLNGVQWKHAETIFSKFKFSKTISAQLMDWDQCYNIPVHKLGQNYV